MRTPRQNAGGTHPQTGHETVEAVGSKEGFDREKEIMTLFIKSAEAYTKLSAAALFLTVTFLRQVAGLPEGNPLPRSPLLVACWISFLLAILAGASYQYFAVKYLEWKSGLPRAHGTFFERFARHPWLPYAVMLVSFYLGAVLFTWFAIARLWGV